MKPSREEVLKLAGEPLTYLYREYGNLRVCQFNPSPANAFAAYSEAQLLAMYEAGAAKGAEDMRDRAGLLCDAMAAQWNSPDAYGLANHIRALPITLTNTEGEHG